MARTKAPKPPSLLDEPKADGWANAATGIGVTGVDKRAGAMFSAPYLPELDAVEIWSGDDMAARIVETLPFEMTRAGWEICIADDKDTAEALEDEGDRLEL